MRPLTSQRGVALNALAACTLRLNRALHVSLMSNNVVNMNSKVHVVYIIVSRSDHHLSSNGGFDLIAQQCRKATTSFIMKLGTCMGKRESTWKSDWGGKRTSEMATELRGLCLLMCAFFSN